MSYVLAVDPGGTTGWAFRRPQDGVISGQDDFNSFVYDADRLVRNQVDVVVCERYVITAETLRKSRQTTALEVIGFLRGACYINGAEFVLQSPGDAKRFATDERLKSAGWYVPGQPHANDAARHLLLYLVKNGQMEVPA